LITQVTGRPLRLGAPRAGHVAAYAACAWALIFAVPSFVWAAGVDLGTETIAADVEAAGIADPMLLAVTGVLRVLAGLVALALVRPWGRRIPRRLLLVAAWGAAASFLAYAVVNLVDHGLMEAGARSIPEELGADAVRWHLLLGPVLAPRRDPLRRRRVAVQPGLGRVRQVGVVSFR
jgi:Protein of unknown function (DUF3995)